MNLIIIFFTVIESTKVINEGKIKVNYLDELKLRSHKRLAKNSFFLQKYKHELYTLRAHQEQNKSSDVENQPPFGYCK